MLGTTTDWLDAMSSPTDWISISGFETTGIVVMEDDKKLCRDVADDLRLRFFGAFLPHDNRAMLSLLPLSQTGSTNADDAGLTVPRDNDVTIVGLGKAAVDGVTTCSLDTL